jgi:hypothetical protein
VGDIVIALRLAPWFVIFRVADAFIDPELAVMMLEPTAAPVAIPFVPTNATLALEDLHCTDVLRLLELPSLNVPVAVNCWLDPTPTDVEVGVTARAVSVGGFPFDPECDAPPQAIRFARNTATIKAYASFMNFSNPDVTGNKRKSRGQAGDGLPRSAPIQSPECPQQFRAHVSVCRVLERNRRLSESRSKRISAASKPRRIITRHSDSQPIRLSGP